MPVTFILGRAGAGKTRYCLDAILSRLARTDDQQRLVLLVPEQASFQMERALALRAPGRGYWRVEVLSFSRLTQRVLQHVGQPPAVLSAEGRTLALRAVVARREASPHAFHRAAATSGFFVQLGQSVEELLAEGVQPTDLLAAAAKLQDQATASRVREISEIYADYMAWLGPGRIDPAARLAVLRERLDQLDWLPRASIWVDGFAGFTGQELETLVALARLARELSVTLLVDPAAPAVQNPAQVPDELGLFQRTELTYQRLLKLFLDAGLEVRPPVRLPAGPLPRLAETPRLAALEAGLAAPLSLGEERLSAGGAPAACGLSDAVRVWECATHRDELRAAARYIRTLIADSRGGLRFRDFALIARDLEPFAALVAEVFEEYEIPYFLDRRRPLRAHPLSRLMSALLEAVLSNCEVRPMVRLLRTGLLPLSREQAEELENIVVNESVRGMELWRRPAWDLGSGRSAVAVLPGQRAEIAAALSPLVLLAGNRRGATGASWATTLYQALEQLGVRWRVEQWIADARRERRWESAETHRLAWTGLCALLTELHDVLGDLTLSASEVAQIMESSLGELTLGLAPPTVDQVLVSAIERSRHPDIKHAWLFAFNEGVFPARPPQDLLLSSAQRDALTQAGLPAPAAHREDALSERLLAYIACTRPSVSLTISYAVVGEDGDPLLPSPLLSEVLRALPGLVVRRDELHPPPTHVRELARGYLSLRGRAQQACQRRRYERLCDEVRRMPARAGTLDWLLRGMRYGNTPAPIGNYRLPAAGPAGVIWDCSPSEVETYLRCPFKHFVTYGLRLDAARGPRPLRWDLGELAHVILADVTRRALQQPGGVRVISDSKWQELLTEALDAFRQQQPADQQQRRPDLVFMTDLLVAFLRDLVAVHAERWRRGRFEPRWCEHEFQPDGGARRAIELKLADGARVHLHGKIDRLDAAELAGQTWLLVYDYKSSGVGPIAADYLSGADLQLFLYLLAAQQSFPRGQSVRPAGVLLAPLYPALGVLENNYATAAGPREQLMYMYRPRGLVDERAARLLDENLGSVPSPVAHLRLKKDGGFYANSDVRPAAEITRRIELAAQTVRQAAEGVRRGVIDVAPLVENRTRACRYCDFQAVCRFDPAYNRSRAAERVLPRLSADSGEKGENA